MTPRVFISYRTSDGADKATALARELDVLFGDAQVFLDKDDLPAGSRWRDVIAHTLGARPVLLVLVTPQYPDALDAQGRRPGAASRSAWTAPFSVMRSSAASTPRGWSIR